MIYPVDSGIHRLNNWCQVDIVSCWLGEVYKRDIQYGVSKIAGYHIYSNLGRPCTDQAKYRCYLVGCGGFSSVFK